MSTLTTRSLRTVVSGWESLLVELWDAAAEISDLLERLAPNTELPIELIDRGGMLCEHAHRLRKIAAVGVREFSLSPLPDGSGLVTLRGRAFILPRSLANILEVLLLDEGPSKDRFVAPKSYDVIKAFLEKREGDRPENGAIRQRISELAKELRRYLVNPYLVENSSNDGWRLLKRREF